MPVGKLEKVFDGNDGMPELPKVSSEDIKMTCFQILQACNQNEANEEMPCEVGVSTREGAGDGLFASRDIKKGGFITTYPCHYIVLRTEKGMEFACCHDLFPDIKVAHDDLHKYEDFAMNIYDGFTILGCPQYSTDSRFRGHKINDLSYTGCEVYDDRNCNSEFHLLDIIANKDIKKGEEISVRYGENFWFSPLDETERTRHSEINKKKDYVILDENGSEGSTGED